MYYPTHLTSPTVVFCQLSALTPAININDTVDCRESKAKPSHDHRDKDVISREKYVMSRYMLIDLIMHSIHSFIEQIKFSEHYLLSIIFH